MTATTATQTHTHSDRALGFLEVFENLTVEELNAVQRVYIKDYMRFRAAGSLTVANRILSQQINPLGEAIGMRDGTCRECAEGRA